MNVSTQGTGQAEKKLVDGTYVFPTTFAQQRLWFLEQLQPGGTSYLIPWFLRIEGKVNGEALSQSLNQIIDRHEILRTTFCWKDGMPVQLVHPALTLDVPVRDLSVCTDPLAEAEKLAREEAHTPLDLERGPLVRAQLLRLSEEDHVLLLTVHHIIFDGGSRSTLVRELATFYEANCTGTPAQMPPPKLQYADYAVWQRKHCQGATLEKHLDYWRKQLAGSPASLELPTDRPRPALQSFNGAKLPIAISKELADRLRTFSRSQGATLFMTLLAAFQALLSRCSNQDDIVVGTPIANRNRTELEDMIGFFANTLALRTRFTEGSSFQDVLAQVKETTLAAYDHQDLPFEKLVEEIHPERNLGQNPVFQILFSLQNLLRPNFELAGLKLKFMDLGEATAKFDVSVFLSETESGIEGRFEFNTDLFDKTTIQRLIERYLVLLDAAIQSPQKPISQLPLLTERERTQVVAEFNATDADFPAGLRLQDFVERTAALQPESVAVVCEDQHTTYRQLNEQANQIAHHLISLGAGPDILVGVFLERNSHLLPAILGVLKSGSAYVPLDPSYPKERIGFILEDANAPLLLTQRSLLPVLPQTNARTVCLDGEWNSIASESSENLAVRVQPSDLAYVLYTSGSTGKPKGVQIEHRNLTNFLASMQRKPGFTADDILLAVTTLSFDIAGLELYLPLVCGGQVAIASREEALNPSMLQALLRKTKATVMQATPATWRMLIESGWTGSSQLKILCGGEALPADLAGQLLPRCGELWNMYGPTETTIWSSVYQVSQDLAGTAPIGKPIANTTMYVLDAHLQPLPVGVAGELYIGGEGVARGYWKRPELTAEKFLPDPFCGKPDARLYRTGDLAKFLPDGNVQYLGRTDFQVKVRGFRIELGEIENAMVQHPAVRQAVVAAREDRPGDKRLVAYAVLAPGQHLSISDLRSHLRKTLPEYMIPAALVELDSLPLTPNGKVDRKRLPAPEFSAESSAEKVGPRDTIEAKLLQIWQQILGTSAIGVTDNFFDLGGHSLMAVRLISEIKAQMGKDIPLAALFQGATIEYLANIVRGSLAVSPTLIHKIQTGGSQPPFFAAVLAGVNALGYIPLSKHLGPEQPIYALQRPGPGPLSTGRPYTRKEYEEVAAEYIQAMRNIQPEGPYHIGGTCEGAHIAFEMVRQLESAGQKVNVLAIFDTWVLENTQIRSLWRLYYYWRRLRQLRGLPLRSVATASAKAVRLRLHRWTGLETTPKDWTQTYWPGEKFVAPRIRSRITVFKIPKQPFYYRSDELLGWGARTLSGVDTEVIAHGRHRLLLREPYVRELASALSRVLRRVQPASIVEREDTPVHEVLVSR